MKKKQIEETIKNSVSNVINEKIQKLPKTIVEIRNVPDETAVKEYIENRIKTIYDRKSHYGTVDMIIFAKEFNMISKDLSDELMKEADNRLLNLIYCGRDV